MTASDSNEGNVLLNRTRVKPPRQQPPLWVCLILILAAVVTVLLFSWPLQSRDEGWWGRVAPLRDNDRWVDGGVHSTISAGLWASPRGMQGRRYMQVEPGNDVDSDEWYFRLENTRVFCVPLTTADTWHFKDCELHGSLAGFEATVSKVGFRIDLTLDYKNHEDRLRMTKFDDWLEPWPGAY